MMKEKRQRPDRVELRLVLSRRQLKGGLAAFLLIGTAGIVGSETLSLVASFPSPIGIYKKLVATGQVVLARDGGNVGIGVDNPTAKLDIDGSARVQSTLNVGSSLDVGGALGLAPLA